MHSQAPAQRWVAASAARNSERDSMPRILQILFSRCTDPSRELEFNRWYTHTHLPDLSAAAGFLGARRFSNALPGPGDAPYLVIYEIEAPNAALALRDLTRLALEAFDAGRHIDCIAGVPAGSSPTGGQWQEIEPASLAPLERHDYPPAPDAIRSAMLASIEKLTRLAESDRER